jgi:hypothetical protein
MFPQELAILLPGQIKYSGPRFEPAFEKYKSLTTSHVLARIRECGFLITRRFKLGSSPDHRRSVAEAWQFKLTP